MEGKKFASLWKRTGTLCQLAENKPQRQTEHNINSQKNLSQFLRPVGR